MSIFADRRIRRKKCSSISATTDCHQIVHADHVDVPFFARANKIDENESNCAADFDLSTSLIRNRRRMSKKGYNLSYALPKSSSSFSALFPWPTNLLVCTSFLSFFLGSSLFSFTNVTNAQYFEPQQPTPPPPSAAPTVPADQFAPQQQYTRASLPHLPPPAAFQQHHTAFSGSVGEGVFARQASLPQTISGGNPVAAGRASFRVNPENAAFQQSQRQQEPEPSGGATGAYTDQASAVGFKCREPFGHHAVRQNCSLFIVCVFGNPVVQECQGTTVYNHKLGTCDWRHNSECPAPGDGFFAIGLDAQGQQITASGLPPMPPGSFSFDNVPPQPPQLPPPHSLAGPKPASSAFLPPLSSLSSFGAENTFTNNFNRPKQQQPPPPPPQQFFLEQQRQPQPPPSTRPPFLIQPPPQQNQPNFRPNQLDGRQTPITNAGRGQPIPSQPKEVPSTPPQDVGRSRNDQQQSDKYNGSERLTQRQNQSPQPQQQTPPPPASRPPALGIDPKSRTVHSSTLPWWLEQSLNSAQQPPQRRQPDFAVNSRVPVDAVTSEAPAVLRTTPAPPNSSAANVDTSKHPWWLEPVQPPALEAAASTQEPRGMVAHPPRMQDSAQLMQQQHNLPQQLADIEKQLFIRDKLIQQQQQRQSPNVQSNMNAISPWNSPPPSQNAQQQNRPLSESESAIRPTHQIAVNGQHSGGDGRQPSVTDYNFKSGRAPPSAQPPLNNNKMQPQFEQRTIVEHIHVQPEIHDIVIPDQRPFWMAPGEQATLSGRGGLEPRIRQVDGGNVQLVKILPNDYASWHIVPPAGDVQQPPPPGTVDPGVSTPNLQQKPQPHPLPSPPPPSSPPMRLDRPNPPPPQQHQTHRHPPMRVAGRTFPHPPQHFIPPPPKFSRAARHTPTAPIYPSPIPSTAKTVNLSQRSYPEYARPSPLPTTIHQFQPQMRKFERFTALHTPAVRAQQRRMQYEQQFSNPTPPSHPSGFHGRSLIAAAPYVLNFHPRQEFTSEPTEIILTRTTRATTRKPWWVSADALSPTVPAGVAVREQHQQQPVSSAPTIDSFTYWTPMPNLPDHTPAVHQRRQTPDLVMMSTPPPPAIVELPVVVHGLHPQQQHSIETNANDIINAANKRYYQQQQAEAAAALDYLKPWWLDVPTTPMINPYELQTSMPTTAKPWWIMNWWDAAQHASSSPPVMPSYGFTPSYHHLPSYLGGRGPTTATAAYGGVNGLPLYAAAPSLSHWLTVPLQTAMTNPNDLFRFSFPLAVATDQQQPQPDQNTNTTAKPANITNGDKPNIVSALFPSLSPSNQTTNSTSSPPIFFDTSNMNNEMSATWKFVSDIGVVTTTPSPTTPQPSQQFETTAPWWYAEPPLYGTLAPSFEWSPPQQTADKVQTNTSSSNEIVSLKSPRSISSHAALTSSSLEYAPPIIQHKKSSRPLMVELNKMYAVKYGGDNNIIRVANSKLVMDPFGPGFKHQHKPWRHEVEAANVSDTDNIDTSVVLSSKANVMFSNGGAPARTANLALPSTTIPTDCDLLKCNIPHCWCGGTATPGNFPLSATPQIVLLTFDDALTEQNYQIYQRILRNRTNPNGCPIRATFYISHEWSEYHQIQNLYSDGHEIASHSVSHTLATRNTSKLEWAREIDGQRRILSQFANIPLEDIRGMRAPYLQPGGNAQYEMLWEQGFLYDSSLSVSENNPPFWPYTLDYRLPHKCWIPPCPTKPYPGLWQVPMVHWEDLLGYRCAMADACHNPGSAEEVYELLTKNFMRHYKTNRAPFGMFYHSAWFMHHYHLKGFEKFLDELLEQPDVWLVSTADAIAWMQQPTPLSHIDQFEPWQCDSKRNNGRRLRNGQPPAERCTKPSVCPASFRGGMRYLRTCAACPAEYPWLNNPTGARQQNFSLPTISTLTTTNLSP